MITEKTDRKVPVFNAPYTVATGSGMCVACFASIGSPFYMRSFVPREEAEKYLKIIHDEEPFLIEFCGFQGGNEKEPIYRFEFKNYDRTYRILLGNLLKGTGEHRYFQMPIALKEEEGSFFDRSHKYFKEMLSKIGKVPGFTYDAALRYGEGHQWWKYRTKWNYKGEIEFVPQDGPMYRGTTHTITELFERENHFKRNYQNYQIWDYCLGRISAEDMGPALKAKAFK